MNARTKQKKNMKPGKDSGVAWIPLKHCVAINERVLHENTSPNYEFRYLDIGSVDFYNGITGYSNETFATAPSRARRIVKKGDVIVSMVRTYLKAIAPITDDNDVIVSTGFAVLTPKNILPTFLAYACKSNAFCDEVERHSTGTSYPAITANEMAVIKIPTPPLPEQTAIANFLDAQCGKIDALVDVEERMIEELAEYKKSVIYKAVTKGIKKTTLKDSGVAWIPLKHCVAINERVLHENTSPNYEFRYLDIGSVDFYNGITGYSNETFATAPSRARRIVKKGDVIVSMVRTYLKAIASITDDNDVIVSTGFAVLTPKNILPTFLAYVCKSNAFCDEVERHSTGTSYPAITANEMAVIKIPIPPLPEQKSIAAYLDKKCSNIDALISTKRQKITELKDYKKSLIYAYVTGKKEVPA